MIGSDGEQLLSSSSLDTFKKCPKLYFYRYVAKREPRWRSIDLLWGSAMDKAIERMELLRWEGTDREISLRLVLHSALIESWKWPQRRMTKAKNRLTLARAIVTYVDRWWDDPITTMIFDGKPMVQQEIIVTLEGRRFYLRLDRVGVLGDIPAVVDLKTTGHPIDDWWVGGFTPNGQMTLYTIGLSQLLGANVQYVVIDGVSSTERETICERALVQRTPKMIEEWLWDLPRWLERLGECEESGVWPMNDTACFRCEYRRVCQTSPEGRGAVLGSGMFVDREFVK